MFSAMPSPAQIYASVDRGCNCPLTVREGRDWISTYVQGKEIKPVPVKKIGYKESETVLKAKNIWFRYEKRDNDILKNILFHCTAVNGNRLLEAPGLEKQRFCLSCQEQNPHIEEMLIQWATGSAFCLKIPQLYSKKILLWLIWCKI